MTSYLETEPTAVGRTQTCGGARKSPHEHGLRRLGLARDALLKRISCGRTSICAFLECPESGWKNLLLGCRKGSLHG